MDNYKQLCEHLVEKKLSFEKYFILYCLYTKDNKMLSSYVADCNILDTTIFEQLSTAGYININNMPEGLVYYEFLSITEKGSEVVRSGNMWAVDDTKMLDNFEEFRTFYPASVKQGMHIRRLQGNLKRCKELYNKLLLETTHDILCRCAKAYHNEKIAARSEMYMQNLETWLNQRNYQQYLEDIDKVEEKDSFTDDI